MNGFEDHPIDWAPAAIWTDDKGETHQTIEFIVPGLPVPKGNIIKGRYGGYHDPTKGLADWLKVVALQSRIAMNGAYRRRKQDRIEQAAYEDTIPLPRFTTAVMLDVTFILRRPKSTPKTKTPKAVKKPDLSKLIRGIEDAMTGIVWDDDSQVIETHCRKRLADIDESTGAIVLVTTNVNVE